MNDSKHLEIMRQIHIVFSFPPVDQPLKHDGFPSVPSIVSCHRRTDYKCTHKLQSSKSERQHFMFSIHLLTKRFIIRQTLGNPFRQQHQALHHLTTTTISYLTFSVWPFRWLALFIWLRSSTEKPRILL